MREAVIIPRGREEVAVTLDALEAFANRRLGADDAVTLVVEEARIFRRAANAVPADDGVVTLTKKLLLERSWTAEAYDETHAE